MATGWEPRKSKITARELIIMGVVVVALVAALAAIFLKNEADAKRTASFRNLQQWGIALNLYLIDNENQLPEVGVDPVTPEQKSAWYNAMPPYISQTPLADLPPGQRPRPGVPSLWIDPSSKPVKVWDQDAFYFNYAMNKYLQPVKDTRSFRIFEINFPGSVVFMVEVAGYSPGAGPEDVKFRQGSSSGTGPDAKTHVLFCDGHVQLVTKKQLVDNPDALSAASAEQGVSWYQK